MTSKAAAICLALLFFALSTLACMQFTGTTYGGKRIETERSGNAHNLQFYMEMNHHDDGEQMEATLRGSTNYNDRSDYALALLYLGRTQEAVDRLKQLESEQPGQYFIAANLGTAYELAGNNAEGLRWINEGIKRNHDSHEGTEWLHAKILEAKIAQEKDPDYFKKHSVLELQPGNPIPMVEVDGQKLFAQDITKAIQYQLMERVQLVKPTDPAVASLLFDYASIEASTKTLEEAKPILELAMQYGYPSDRVQPLIKSYDQKIAWGKARATAIFVLSWVAIAGLLFIPLYLIYRRRIAASRSG